MEKQRFGIKSMPRLLKAAFQAWLADKAPTLGAALAYFTVFSLAPFLIIAISVAGMAFGEEAAKGQVAAQIAHLVGPEASKAIEGIIENASKPGTGSWAAAIGVVTMLLGASGIFGQLQDTLNTIWEVTPAKKGGFLKVVASRFLSLAMVFGTCFLLLVSLLLSAVLAALSNSLIGEAESTALLLQVLDFVLSVGVITVLFALLYKFLPDAIIAWRDVWLGAFITALLFSTGKILIGLYLGRSGVASSYGAAGSVIVVLLWAYYASQIVFFGAEVTKSYADMFGSRIRPIGEPQPEA